MAWGVEMGIELRDGSDEGLVGVENYAERWYGIGMRKNGCKRRLSDIFTHIHSHFHNIYIPTYTYIEIFLVKAKVFLGPWQWSLPFSQVTFAG